MEYNIDKLYPNGQLDEKNEFASVEGLVSGIGFLEAQNRTTNADLTFEEWQDLRGDYDEEAYKQELEARQDGRINNDELINDNKQALKLLLKGMTAEERDRVKEFLAAREKFYTDSAAKLAKTEDAVLRIDAAWQANASTYARTLNNSIKAPQAS